MDTIAYYDRKVNDYYYQTSLKGLAELKGDKLNGQDARELF